MFKLLAKASEYLAPNLKPEEELFLQWHNLVKELKRRNGTQINVEDTDIPLRLQWVFNLIQQDSLHFHNLSQLNSVHHDYGIGPCLEFALRYKVFDWLVALARQDKPAGLKSYVLFFVTNFVRAPSTAGLLSKSFIYKPLARLANYCGSSRCSPWDREEMAFLQSLVDSIENDPCLANLFLKGSLHSSTEKLDADLKSLVMSDLVLSENKYFGEGSENGDSDSRSQFDCSSTDSSPGHEKFTFPLLNSLLLMALNPDPLVSTQARNAVITVLRTREPVVCQAIAKSCVLSTTLRNQLRKLYVSIPATSDALDTLLRNANGDLEHVVRSFSLWINFIDQILMTADVTVNGAVSETLKRDLISGLGFGQDWLGNSSDRNSLAVATFTRIYKAAESSALLTVLSDVLLDEGIFEKFLFVLSETDLNLLAFDLLDVVVQKPTYRFVEQAFLRYLESRMYIKKDQRMQDAHWNTATITEAADRAAMFRDVFPTQAKSCTVEEERRDCENYVRESHYSMTRIVQRCKEMDWPVVGPLRPCNVLLAEESSFFDGHAFNEGPLLRMLFMHLSNLLNQSYVLNLRITGIISKICLIPHPSLREYLLDPTVPLSNNCSSLYRCLVNLVQQIDGCARNTPDFREKLIRTRQCIRNGQWSEKCVDVEGVLLCGVITLEEFCKEIATRASASFNELGQK